MRVCVCVDPSVGREGQQKKRSAPGHKRRHAVPDSVESIEAQSQNTGSEFKTGPQKDLLSLFTVPWFLCHPLATLGGH